MPLPSRKDGEDRKQFMSRCMSDPKVNKEYPDNKQRVAVCISKATEGMDYIEAADFSINVQEYGYTEEITEANFVIPEEDDYVDFGEEVTEWDVAADRPGLWENIRRKKEREGKNYKPAKTVKEGRPTQEQLKRAQSEVDAYADHAEADKPGPKDPRRTPAPKKDQKKGSKKNIFSRLFRKKSKKNGEASKDETTKKRKSKKIKNYFGRLFRKLRVWKRKKKKDAGLASEDETIFRISCSPDAMSDSTLFVTSLECCNQ